ncbi:prolyl-tRNA synthetase [Thecamonas trahens ATCC 50062]|uniref:Prolyl-tRNA synthetase n=1 Tax=Thecamonas trahens ATCC 50062 TaxID=461836 RepID=A0A0L0D1M4_THETB|nr:prolyl-tRNA synthetase [Thecamonas trahens ATCC 50062]KNC46035.1 prolyl-tRNA synthetase [Thecamonas trahens ATCC 50062]|eukprot:XP_013763015.1 prolyl-tRNA synthetase [Thecamonas trahens ATCC 50062]
MFRGWHRAGVSVGRTVRWMQHVVGGGSARVTRAGSVFTPTLADVPADASTLSHGLLLRAGYARALAPGLHMLLPMGRRVLENVSGAVRAAMDGIDGNECTMPHLVPRELWEMSGRLLPQEADSEQGDEKEGSKGGGSEIFALEDRRGKTLVLAPTHEEVFTALVAAELDSYKSLPLRLYQIGTKYRDEIRPRFGLMRAREFVMKDMYTFDVDETAARETYATVTAAYTQLLVSLGLRPLMAAADTGNIGGSLSHEFHVMADVGEDAVLQCSGADDGCGYAANVEEAGGDMAARAAGAASVEHTVLAGKATYSLQLPSGIEVNRLRLTRVLESLGHNGLDGVDVAAAPSGAMPLEPVLASASLGWEDVASARAGDGCPCCEAGELVERRGIEVGHAFLLGTKYSSGMGAVVRVPTRDGGGLTAERPIEMGCYGIGVSRLMAAVQEVHGDKDGMRWPLALAPFVATLIVPPARKVAHSPELAARVARLEAALSVLGEGRVLVDDRDMSNGRKKREAALAGIPAAILVHSKAPERAEVHIRMVTSGGAAHDEVVVVHEDAAIAAAARLVQK